MRRPVSWRRAAALLTLLMAPLGACRAELPGALLVLQNGRISPAQLELPAGQRLKLRLQNKGPGPIEFENLDLRIEKVLAEGGESFVVLAPMRPGRYRFVDEFHPDTGVFDLVIR
ncbi:cupredoxin domain-containing protein [Mitsuaria sp. WAJ17]|nr:cupredoxin domain-containing protein [Mitsuaria sp. WAJ17]